VISGFHHQVSNTVIFFLDPSMSDTAVMDDNSESFVVTLEWWLWTKEKVVLKWMQARWQRVTRIMSTETQDSLGQHGFWFLVFCFRSLCGLTWTPLAVWWSLDIRMTCLGLGNSVSCLRSGNKAVLNLFHSVVHYVVNQPCWKTVPNLYWNFLLTLWCTINLSSGAPRCVSLFLWHINEVQL